MSTPTGAWLVALLVAARVAAAAADPAGQYHARRQGQYSSFANSSTLSDSPSSSELNSASPSSQVVQFSYSPESLSSSIPSPSSSPSSALNTYAASQAAASSSPSVGSISRAPPYPTAGPGTAPSSSFFPITASRILPPENKQCGGLTVNVRSASFDWWNPYTVQHPVSTLSFQHDSTGQETGWTILPETEDFSVASAFANYDCDNAHPHIATDADSTDTWTYYDCSFVPQTMAAATTVTTLTGFKSPSATTGTGFDVPNVRATTPPDPTISLNAINSTFAPSNNFVYFSQYEIEKSDTTTYGNGSGACVTTTSSYNLSQPYAFTYSGPDPQTASDPVAAVTADLDTNFLSYVGQANATAGSYTALPTVIIIVEEVFRATVALYAAATMRSATQLDTPSAQLPPGVSASSTDDWASDLYTSLTNSARIESTAQILLVPPPSSTADAPTTSDQATSPETNSGGGSPGDANSVLSQALGPAIMQGLGVTTATRPTVDIAGTTAAPTSVSAVVVGGQTVVAGGPAITVGNTVVSLADSGNSVVVGGITSQVPAGPSAIFNVAGVRATATTAAAFDIAGQTLAAGGAPVTVDGTKLSLASGGDAIVAGTSTLRLNPPAVITVAAKTITADSETRFVLGPGQILTTGGTAVISGTTVSLVQAGTAIVINGRTTALGTVTADASRITAAPVLVVDGQTYSPGNGGGYVIHDQTLMAGGAITFTGRYGLETVSLDRMGSMMTDIVSGVSHTSTLSASAPAITLGGQVFTAISGKGATYVISGQTITAGAVKTVVVGGSTYIVSLASVPTAVVIQTVSNGRAVSTSTETLITGITAAASVADKSPTAAISAAATSAPATGQASSMMMEMLTALFGAFALGAAALL